MRTRRVVRPRGRVADRGMVVDRQVDDVIVDDVVVDDVVEDRVVEDRVVHAPWSPAQLVALAIGAMFTILGAIALARTGINFENVSAQHVTVAGFHHTALLAVVEFVIGLCLIGVGAVPGGSRPTMTFFGMLLLGVGIVVAAEPGAFHRALGTHGGHGVLYLISGLTLLIAAMVAPIFLDGGRSAYRRRSDVVQRRSYR